MLHFTRWKVLLILGVCVFGVAFASPNLLSQEGAEALPTWLPHKQISLGLDLQGGSHLLLEVGVETVVRERLNALVDEIRAGLRGARIGYSGLGVAGASVKVKLRDPADLEQARGLLREIDRDALITAGEDGAISITLDQRALAVIRDSAVAQSLEIVRRRIDETGTREPTIQRQGLDRIVVQLPGVDDPDRIKKLLGKTAKLTFQLVDVNTSIGDALMGRLPAGSQILEADDEIGPSGRPIQYVVRKRIMVGGDRLIDAQPTFQDNQPVVSFRFDTVGGRKFGEATSKNVGRPFAIVLDNKVISAPVIRSAITGGSGIITGGFSVQEATDLALLLRAGALPAPLVILEERTVGPDLGADSIRAGKIAAVLGLAFVVVFMAVCYGGFGLAADVALLLNIVIIAAALSLLQATLTLPGIAGIVLTIGMAVDANVLVFERIREELASGRTPFSSVDAGYQRALTTIIDSNVTTFIAAIILFGLGSGPVKGFGVTLAIGICTSMFTAVMVTRLIIVTWLRHRRPQTLPI
ncbi:MAG: protein translocase subunit SecD [Proteobacteria bacterium]|nr:protein translocase subunit SecD [Pseudomonadota bacterium]